MPLPRGDEYNQAVQNPRTSFYDSELKLCQVETTPLGLPKPYSGGFTTTYKLYNYQNKWAVRCFTRDIKDLQIRYQAIGNFLSRNNNGYFVDARYLQQGIKIGANAFPIIKMQWLEGETLNSYINRIYNQKASVERLLSEFIKLVNHLSDLGIAHGDLQHGNILVKNNQLYLIDYDGMYFPELANLQTNEIGHPNYQHPKRTSQYYNKDIDRFSAIVIYSGLKAISAQPNLWKKYDNSENILFKNLDFSNLQNSQLFQELCRHNELKKIGERLIGVCNLEYSKIPTLSDFINGNFAYSTVTIATPPTTIRSAYQVLDAKLVGQMLEHIGDRVEVVGRLTVHRSGRTRYGNPYLFLNVGIWPRQTFTIVIWSEALSIFRTLGVEPESFVGKWISVIGVLENYEGKPQISIDQTSQIQILRDEEDAKSRLQNRPTTTTPNNRTTTTRPNIPEDIWDEIYRGRTVTPQPTVNRPRTSTPPQTQRPSTSPPYQPTRSTPSSSSKSSKSENVGCVVQVIGALIVGGIGASIGGVGGFILGGIIGFAIASALVSFFS